MSKFAAILVIVISAAGAFASDLQKQVEALAAQHRGKIAFFAKDLKTGATVAVDADVPVQTASVIKVPIMIEAMHQVKAGKHRLEERLKLTKANQVEGSGVLTMLQPGLEPTLQDAITLMIVLSDNTASNLVIDDMGIPAVNARIAQMGLKNTYLHKKVFMPPVGPTPPDQKKFGLGKTTAREMAQILESIERCDLGDNSLCGKMIGILKNQQDHDMIPRYLESADTTVETSAIAHKTGAEDDVRNDVGIVYTKHGPIVISAFTYDNKDQSWTVDNSAEVLVAKLAKTVVDAWAGPVSDSGTK
ncbi:MAG: serine hydrolase [Terriglobales bacterium]